jgi:hypothetical protein
VSHLADHAAALWLTLYSCQTVADRETAMSLGQALRCLDDVATMAQALPCDEGRLWRDELRDIDDLVGGIFDHLRGEGAEAE